MLFIFFLLCVALCQHELPRFNMLSSDPDQHAFFGAQIMRLGGVPYSQAEWGPDNFGYPAGTGVLIFLVASFSFLTIENATTVIPTLQTLFVVFTICELATKNQHSLKVLLPVVLAIVITYSFVLPYGLEQSKYHMAGYGRLSSLWIYMLAVCFYWHSHFNWYKHKLQNDSSTIAMGLVLIFLAASLNPVNVFLVGSIVGFSFLVSYPVRKWWLAGFSILLLPLLIIDPYYFDIILGADNKSGAELITSTKLSLEFLPLLKETIDYLPKQVWRFEFFDSVYLPHAYMFVTLLLAVLAPVRPKVFLKAACLIIFIYLAWVVLSSAFSAVRADDSFRLLFPYLQYAKLQVLYLMTFLLIAYCYSSLFAASKSIPSSLVSALLICFVLVSFQSEFKTVNKKSRVDYCGSMGCFRENDRIVLAESRRLYNLVDKEKVTPKMLIPNRKAIHGNERWLTPMGGGRSAPYHETFPIAFYYYQGEDYYTFSNYEAYVCQSFDTEWLSSKNIQYLFIPSNMHLACIYEIDQLGEKFETLIEAGNSKLLKIY